MSLHSLRTAVAAPMPRKAHNTRRPMTITILLLLYCYYYYYYYSCYCYYYYYYFVVLTPLKTQTNQVTGLNDNFSSAPLDVLANSLFAQVRNGISIPPDREHTEFGSQYKSRGTVSISSSLAQHFLTFRIGCKWLQLVVDKCHGKEKRIHSQVLKFSPTLTGGTDPRNVTSAKKTPFA